jgi:hypothetical protein
VISLSPSQLSKLNAVLPAALRTFVGADSFVPNDALMCEFAAQSFGSRRRELICRFFHHLCLADVDSLLGRVFRARVAEVKNGGARLSFCMTLRIVLTSMGLQAAWDAMPNNAHDPIWENWNVRVHRTAVQLDHEERAMAVRSRPSLALFASLKPLDQPRRAAYIVRRGLASWVKLRLRTNSLPLLSMLAKHSKHQLAAESTVCRMCSSGVEETVIHFVAECPALQREREALIDKASADEQLMAIAGATRLLCSIRSAPSQEWTQLILRSHELPPSKLKKAAPSVEQLTQRFEELSLPFLAQIWRKRAELLGGVPMLDMKGERIILSQLRDDGRCRLFATGTVSR